MCFFKPFPMCLLAADGTDPATGLAVLVGVLVLLWFVSYFARRYEKKRTGQFQQIAEELGLPFFPEGDDSLLDGLGHFYLFSQGRSKKIKNMLHGEANDVELAIFDYRYTIGSGKRSHRHKQSVIYFRSPKLSLPRFAVRPEGFFHKIGSIFGYQDIDFETNPRFSAEYLLRGDDESGIRELFSDELLTFFESQEEISVEGGGDQLVFYHQDKRIKPDAAREFMEEGFQVFAHFRGSTEA